MLPGPLHLLRSGSSMALKGSFLPTRRDGLARTMLGKALIVVGPPGPHDEPSDPHQGFRAKLWPGGRVYILMREH